MNKPAQLVAIIAALLAAVTAAPAAAEQPFKIIVNRANSTSSLSIDETAALFLRQETTWKDGTAALPVDQSPSAKVRKAFSIAIYGRSVTAIRIYWRKQIFGGRAIPPQELSSDAEVIKYVKKHPGAVGYVKSSADTSGVRVVSVRE